jgi:hypothetical protein
MLPSFSHADETTESTDKIIKKIEINNGQMSPFNSSLHDYTIRLNKGETVPNFTVLTYSDDYTYEIIGAHEIMLDAQAVVTIFGHDSAGGSSLYTLKVITQSNHKNRFFDDISCDNGTISPEYMDTIKDYYIVLPESQNKVAFVLRQVNDKVKYKVIDNSDIEVGKRKKISIEVENDLKQKEIYTFSVFRQNATQPSVSANTLLSSLEINNSQIPIDFNPYQYAYEIEAPRNIHEIKLNAISNIPSNNISIFGQENILNNDPIVMNIVVTSTDSKNSLSIYTLTFKPSKGFAFADVPLLATVSITILLIILSLAFIEFELQKTKRRLYLNGLPLPPPPIPDCRDL